MKTYVNSPGKKLKIVRLLVLIFGAVLFMTVRYYPILKNANNCLFTLGGDGFRAYYVAKYHTHNDAKPFWTYATNYPYGENVFYTDSQPLVQDAIRILKPVVDLSGYTIGILNILMILGVGSGIVFIGLLLTRYNVPVLLSLIIAISICMLSPQNDRFLGHLSLTYMFFIPATVYWLILHYERKSFMHTILLFLLGIFLAGTHLYIYAMFSAIVLLFFIFNFRHYFMNAEFRKSILQFVLIMSPIFIYYLLLYFTDPVTDRPDYPFGFFSYTAHPASILLPLNRPYLRFLTRWIKVHISWEGYAYVGMVCTISLLILLVRYFIRLKKLRFGAWPEFSGNKQMDTFLLIAFILLLYSFALPFSLGLHGLVKYLGPLRQIRALGRFAWPFYYILNMLVFIWLWDLKLKIKNIRIDKLIFIAAVCVIFLEGYTRTVIGRSLNNHFIEFTDHDKFPDHPLARKLKSQNYQTVYPMPYFYLGAEYIAKNVPSEVIRNSFFISDLIGKPNAGNQCARTSLSQACAQLEMMYAPLRVPKVLDEYDSRKPILLTVSNSAPLTKNEAMTIRHADSIGAYGKTILYRISVPQWKSIYQTISKRNRAGLDSLITDQLYNKKIFYANKNWHDNLKKQKPFILPAIRKKQLICTYTLPDSLPTVNYVLYIWTGNTNDDRILTTRFMVTKTGKEGKVLEKKEFSMTNNIYTLLDNLAMLKVRLDTLCPGNTITVQAQNKELIGHCLRIINIALTR